MVKAFIFFLSNQYLSLILIFYLNNRSELGEFYCFEHWGLGWRIQCTVWLWCWKEWVPDGRRTRVNELE